MEWILDNIGTLVVGLILLTVIYFAARSVRHDLHTGGCSGCHGCGGSCSCSCSRYQNQTMKQAAKTVPPIFSGQMEIWPEKIFINQLAYRNKNLEIYKMLGKE